MIHILGLGPGDSGAITVGTMEILKKSKKIYLRTKIHPTVDLLENEKIEFESFDNEYKRLDNFNMVYDSIANKVVSLGKNCDIVYAVPGHPLVSEKTVQIIIEKCCDLNIEYKIYPAVSFIDSIIEALNIDPGDGLQIVDSFDICEYDFSYNSNVIVTQVYNKFIASALKLAVMDYYGEDKDIILLKAIGVKNQELIKKIPIYELDRQEEIDHLTSVYISKEENVTDFRKIIKQSKKLTFNNMNFIDEVKGIIEKENENEENVLIQIFSLMMKKIISEEEYGTYGIKDILLGVQANLNEKN